MMTSFGSDLSNSSQDVVMPEIHTTFISDEMYFYIRMRNGNKLADRGALWPGEGFDRICVVAMPPFFHLFTPIAAEYEGWME